MDYQVTMHYQLAEVREKLSTFVRNLLDQTHPFLSQHFEGGRLEAATELIQSPCFICAMISGARRLCHFEPGESDDLLRSQVRKIVGIDEDRQVVAELLLRVHSTTQ